MSYSLKECRLASSEGRTASFARVIVIVIVIALAGMAASCAAPAQPIQDGDYPTALVGEWRGTVGDDKEKITLKADHTFVCRMRPMGFIATMVWPVRPETLNGNWTLEGKKITLTVTSANNLPLNNQTTSSTIMSFSQRKLTLKVERGETSDFVRDAP